MRNVNFEEAALPVTRDFLIVWYSVTESDLRAAIILVPR
jgi:hypothetical protein